MSVFEPQTTDELSELVRSTLAENRAIAPEGAGQQSGIGNPPERSDIEIRTRHLNRVVDYEPDDQVIVVEAGITLAELQAVLREKRQRLAIDPIGGDGFTVGGMLATNAYGPSALRYGTLKDLIVGIEIVRADGVVARAGGKVVKNVAGFDVSKLMVGSLGTLAIITKATFRLHPLPESSQSLASAMPAEQVFPFVLALREAQLEPSALVAHLDSGNATVEITFEGFGPGVEAQVKTCREICGRFGNESDGRTGVMVSVASAGVMVSVASTGVMVSVASKASEVEPQPQCRLKATYAPSELAGVATTIDKATVFPTLGVMFIDLNLGNNGGGSTSAPQSGAYAHHDTINQLRRRFDTVTVEAMPREWYGKVDAWGEPPAAFGLMRALKERFDPTRRLNPGRFVGGL